MYTILEIHKNDLQYLFLLATEGRVKMVRRAAPRGGQLKVTDEDRLTSQVKIFHYGMHFITTFVT